MNRYIISIVPLTRIPLYRDQSFYYLCKDKIAPGSLVKIPLGKRTINGIVLESKSDFPRMGNIQLKKVISVMEEKFLTLKQIQLAQFISKYYFVSLGIAMKMFVPKIAKTRKTKHIAQNMEHGTINKIKLTPEQKSAIQEITKTSTIYKLQTTNYLLFGPASSGKTQVYFESIKEILKNKKNAQALILLPELTITAQEIQRYGEFFGEDKIAVLHSKLSKGQYYKNWQAVKSGTAQIIIGTRHAVSAPFKNLKIIIVDEEQDISFKQWEMNPHYDARTVAEELANIYGAKIVFGSATPRVETYFRSSSGFAINSSQNRYKLLTLPPLRTVDQKLRANLNMSLPRTVDRELRTTIDIIDLRKEHWKNWKKVKIVSPISEKLESEIRWTLQNKFQTILFINRQGMSTFSACTTCKTVLTCPDCERALTYRKRGNYECLHCKFETGDFPMCPNCQGMTFRNMGLGTEKIEKEIEKLFPSAKIARVDSQSMKKSTLAQTKIWADFSEKKIDILIGTQMIAKAWDLNNVGLVGIIDADSLFAFPDFHTNENAFSLITQAIGRTGRTGARYAGKAIIQTYHVENQIIQWAAEKNYAKLYEYEIKERKSLSYPPFSKIIKLTYRDFSLSATQKEAEKTFAKLKEANNENNNLQIYPPRAPYVPKIRKRYAMQIILKIKNEEKISPSLEAELKSLPNGWQIDVDPISLI
ncbi:MAG TPA: primosomal protein N' [Candidatus Moranbacteria bacterium]|nr:primosomal protein N' [Candidatus Moranbacteria bacterium]